MIPSVADPEFRVFPISCSLDPRPGDENFRPAAGQFRVIGNGEANEFVFHQWAIPGDLAFYRFMIRGGAARSYGLNNRWNIRNKGAGCCCRGEVRRRGWFCFRFLPWFWGSLGRGPGFRLLPAWTILIPSQHRPGEHGQQSQPDQRDEAAVKDLGKRKRRTGHDWAREEIRKAECSLPQLCSVGLSKSSP